MKTVAAIIVIFSFSHTLGAIVLVVYLAGTILKDEMGGMP